MEEAFNPAELLTNSSLLAELERRAKIETGLLERIADAVDNRTYDVFLFIWKYGPATKRQIEGVFPTRTTERALIRLETCGVVKIKDFKYYIQK